MTRKEKIEIMKQDKGETRGTAKSASKVKSENHDRKSEKPQEEELIAVPENAEPEKWQEELKACYDRTAELQDRYLRLSAEFDNFRKRTHKEKSELIKTASEELLTKIIPVVDDFERGLNAINNAMNLEAVKEGMNLIYLRFKEFLQQQGVKEMEAINQEFNTDFHEAVTKIPATDESQKGKVVDIVEKGYYLHDKVIRYPKVVVGE